MSPLAKRYYQRWHTARSAETLKWFLATRPNLSVVQVVEVLLVDQALQWQDAAGPSVEQYLQRFPAVTDQPSLVLELVYGEVRAARRLGLTVDADAYEARFSVLAESLRRQMELSDWLSNEGQRTKPDNGRPFEV